MRILVTGAAGFIGFHLTKALIQRGDEVVGIDNLNNYYDVQLKRDRLANLEKLDNFTFYPIDIADEDKLHTLFAKQSFDHVVNLAAQPGVRYSLENPKAYIDSNLVGFANILEACRLNSIRHLVFASTSSIYGANSEQPYTEAQHTDHPMSLYAATKKSNELMAHSYASIYQLPCTGLRFFTVYGPWGRPDMAIFKFTKNIFTGETIDVYNHGKMVRDFTYVDDIVAGIQAVLNKPATPDPEWNSAQPDPATSYAPYRIYNIGNNQPVELQDFIAAIEEAVGKKAKINYLPLQPGEVLSTHASVDRLNQTFAYAPNTPIQKGVSQFVAWYRRYYQID